MRSLTNVLSGALAVSFIVLIAAAIGPIIKLANAASEETPCSPPIPKAGSERFLIERCNDGAYVIDKEDGSRSWVGSGNGVNKMCDEGVGCVQLSS
jgi:hypothetical protein